MLLDIILNIIYSVIGGFLNLLPVVDLSDGLGNAIYNINGYLSGISFVLPLATILSILGLFLTIEGVLLTISIINWFIRKIPTVN